MVPDDPSSDWEKLVFDSNFPVPKEGTARIERSDKKRVEVWRQQGSNSLLIGDQLYTEWDLSVPQQRSDFIDILGNGLWITPDSFSVDFKDGFLTVEINLLSGSSLSQKVEITSFDPSKQSSNLSTGNEIDLPGHGTLKVIEFAEGTNEHNSFAFLDMDFIHGGQADDYRWIQYVTVDSFQDKMVPYLDRLESDPSRYYDANNPFVQRDSDVEIELYPGNYVPINLPSREQGILRFQDGPSNPLPTQGSLQFKLFLYHSPTDSIIYTFHWGYEHPAP